MTGKWCTGLTSALLICSCSYNEPIRLQAVEADADVAVIGIVSGSEATASLDLDKLSFDLAALVSARDDVTVMSQHALRQTIGAAPHDEMLGSIATYAHLEPHQTQRLMAANLQASYALFARIDADNVEFLPVVSQDIVDQSGTEFARRERQVYITRRTTQLSAALISMRDGQVVWTRRYRVNPETSSAVNRSIGLSLGASLAAAVANTMMQNDMRARYPEPARLQDSVLALLQEVAYGAPFK